ncbi:MAG: SurA N-terminal domain-containing protein [Rhodocyclaceae bacterium]|nr:SurA N-terminal domain-containing protein [Rhodocyclaceae bacterium]
MFESVRNNPRITQGFLALITLPFAFWGLESYVRGAGSTANFATVGKSTVSTQEFQDALREQQARVRAELGERADAALLNSLPVRRAALEGLISRRLLNLQADAGHLRVSDAELAAYIAAVPALQENGKFSPERYALMVANQRMSKEEFESRVRQDMGLQQLLLPIGDAAMHSKTGADLWAAAELEQREVEEAVFLPATFVSNVKLADDAVQKFYETNAKKFEVPELVRVEYLMLSRDGLLGQVSVSEDEIKARYASQEGKYREAETRRASHILINVAKDASDAEVKAAQAKAEAILAKVSKKPSDFSIIAKEQSQDTGTAERGGDLDWFGRNMMVKPFEDAAFSLKENEISGLVRSDFGFHIIMLTGLRAAHIKPLDEVKAQISAELKAEAAAKKFAEVSEGFGNMVFEEEPDSLKPAAEKWKLTIQQSPLLPKAVDGVPQQPLPPPFDSPRLVAAIFSADAVEKKRNTEAIEITSGPLKGALVSARVIEHKPATVQPLEQVKEAIARRLTLEEAAKLAVRDGEAKLDKLNKGETQAISWSAPRTIVRAVPGGMPPDAVRAIFKVGGFKLPGYAGASLPQGGYALYRVSSIKPAATDDTRRATLTQQYARVVAEQEFSAWMEAMRLRYPVVISKNALDAKE